jgi:hypothetical protein
LGKVGSLIHPYRAFSWVPASAIGMPVDLIRMNCPYFFVACIIYGAHAGFPHLGQRVGTLTETRFVRRRWTTDAQAILVYCRPDRVQTRKKPYFQATLLGLQSLGALGELNLPPSSTGASPKLGITLLSAINFHQLHVVVTNGMLWPNGPVGQFGPPKPPLVVPVK